MRRRTALTILRLSGSLFNPTRETLLQHLVLFQFMYMTDNWKELCDRRKQKRDRLISCKNTKRKLNESLKFVSQLFPDDFKDLELRNENIEIPKVTSYPLEMENELDLMRYLLKDELKLPISVEDICRYFKETIRIEVSNLQGKVCSTLEKLECQNLLKFHQDLRVVTFVNFFALRDVYQYKEENLDDTGPSSEVDTSFSGKRKLTEVFPDIPPKSPRNEYVDYWKDKAQELIAHKSFKQRQHHETARQIHDLISTPTAKETMQLEKFKCQKQRIIEFCTYLTLFECKRQQRIAIFKAKSPTKYTFCHKLHYRPVNSASTERKLGDCSFLNTCFHMETCKYIHYELDLNEHELKKFMDRDRKNVERSKFSISMTLFTLAISKGIAIGY